MAQTGPDSKVNSFPRVESNSPSLNSQILMESTKTDDRGE